MQYFENYSAKKAKKAFEAIARRFEEKKEKFDGIFDSYRIIVGSQTSIEDRFLRPNYNEKWESMNLEETVEDLERSIEINNNCYEDFFDST
jgi:hypothetical protein